MCDVEFIKCKIDLSACSCEIFQLSESSFVRLLDISDIMECSLKQVRRASTSARPKIPIPLVLNQDFCLLLFYPFHISRLGIS